MGKITEGVIKLDLYYSLTKVRSSELKTGHFCLRLHFNTWVLRKVHLNQVVQHVVLFYPLHFHSALEL